MKSPSHQGISDREGEDNEERKLPGRLTPLDVEEAPGGAWVRGKWVSDEEIDRAIEEGEAKLLPMVGKVNLTRSTPAQVSQTLTHVHVQHRTHGIGHLVSST